MLRSLDQVYLPSMTLACNNNCLSMTISPVKSYYIRQILYQNRAHLKFIVAPKAAIEAHSLADINAVINSLYPDANEASRVIQKLENLASMHQILKGNEEIYIDNLSLIETEIFWLLGFKCTTPDIKTRRNS